MTALGPFGRRQRIHTKGNHGKTVVMVVHHRAPFKGKCPELSAGCHPPCKHTVDCPLSTRPLDIPITKPPCSGLETDVHDRSGFAFPQTSPCRLFRLYCLIVEARFELIQHGCWFRIPPKPQSTCRVCFPTPACDS